MTLNKDIGINILHFTKYINLRTALIIMSELIINNNTFVTRQIETLKTKKSSGIDSHYAAQAKFKLN